MYFATTQPADGGVESRSEARGRAYAFGWYCFLAFVALTPPVIGNLPPQLGPVSLFRAYDPVGLPKALMFLVLSGLSLASLCVGAIRGEFELRWHPVLWILVTVVVFTGRGAHSDIIVASAKAYTNALNRLLNASGEQPPENV